MDDNNNDERFRSRYTTRRWTGCCIVPILAVLAVLLLTFGAGLFNRPALTPQPRDTAGPETSQRQAFIAFGKQFFAIAQAADKKNELGFREMEKFSQRQGDASGMKSAFRKAVLANHEAAEKYRSLRIPSGLAARDKLRVAVARIGQSFTAREQACETIIRWADKPNDQVIAQEYAGHAQDVNTLTREGLEAFADAAKANGLTDQDAREFLPDSVEHKATQFGTAPAGEGGIRKLSDR